MKRGFAMHELLISLTVLSAVFALATHFAVRQMRVFRQVGEVAAARSQLQQVTEIVRNAFANVSPSTGELLVAQDSATEIRMTTGISFVCGSAPGRVIIPAPGAAVAGLLSSFMRDPAPGDRVSALFSDSAGATWLYLQVASPPQPEGPCGSSPGIDSSWSITTVEPMSLPAGAALRFTRPLRLSLYKSSDNRWYLGAKDWNGLAQQFNAIQPVAGPLSRYEDATDSGLRFTYRDALGAELPQPVDVGRVASVSVLARTSADSQTAVVRLLNGQ